MNKFNIIVFVALFKCFLFSIEIPVPPDVHSIVCTDVNHDNYIDIVIGSDRSYVLNDTITILENNGMGEFNKISFAKNNMHTLKCVNINDDNLPDIVAKVFDSYDIVYYINNGDFTFGEQNVIHSTLADHHEKIHIADMDNDGDNDVIFYLHNTDAYWGISRNNGYGQFSEGVYYNTASILTNLSSGKINSDEFEDILIARASGIQLFYNYFPTFENYIIDSFVGSYSFINDMDNNGFNDLVLIYSSTFIENPSRMKIMYNFGEDTFIEGDTLSFPTATVIIDINDFNNDNFPDLVYKYSTSGYISICTNNQDGTFNEPVSYYIGSSSLGFVASSADLDNNGYNDIAVSRYRIDEINNGVRVLFNDGEGGFVEESVSVDNSELQIENIELNNYPNPFNPTTSIRFSTKETGFIELKVYDIKGRLIKKIINQKMEEGEHFVVWNGNDENNQLCNSGIYLINLRFNGVSRKTSKMILIK